MKRMAIKMLIIIMCSIQGLICTQQIPRIGGFPIFPVLAIYHCQVFPIQMLWRTSTGTLAQIYGDQYYQYDQHMRNLLSHSDHNFEFSDHFSYYYWHELKKCLPIFLNYFDEKFAALAIQNFFLLVWRNPSVYSQLESRAKICSNGSIKFIPWKNVHQIIFQQFLTPMIAYLRERNLISLVQKMSPTETPQILSVFENKLNSQTFIKPVYNIQAFKKVFLYYYTIPGIPLLLSGKRQSDYYKNGNFSWSFSNIILSGKTLSMNFYELSQEIYDLVFNQKITNQLEFPFRSLIFINQSGIFEYRQQNYCSHQFFATDQTSFKKYQLIKHSNIQVFVYQSEEVEASEQDYLIKLFKIDCVNAVLYNHCACHHNQATCDYFRRLSKSYRYQHLCIYHLLQRNKQKRERSWVLNKQLMFICAIQLST